MMAELEWIAYLKIAEQFRQAGQDRQHYSGDISEMVIFP